jgi:hypothetical protein
MMPTPIRIALEAGPKGKKTVAYAPAWPGLERGAKTEAAAIERLHSYLPRYAPIAKLAGLDNEFTASTTFEIGERYPGTGSTDFWGISFAFSGFDKQEMTSEELERELMLMQACWTVFDDVRSRVSAELKKGPRGGGRDRDQIIRHVLANEFDWSPKRGEQYPVGVMLTAEEVQAHRETYVSAIRDFHAEGKLAGKWPLRYLIRHTAYHTLDHTWEMEDKDLTNTGA